LIASPSAILGGDKPRRYFLSRSMPEAVGAVAERKKVRRWGKKKVEIGKEEDEKLEGVGHSAWGRG